LNPHHLKQTGNISYAHVEADYRERAEPAEILKFVTQNQQ
jgi:hypothetical protein